MYQQVYSLVEAKKWFRTNTGWVTCIREGIERNCETYSQAENFYNYPQSGTVSPEEENSDDGLDLVTEIIQTGLIAGSLMDDSPSPDFTDTSIDTSIDTSSFDSGGGDFGGGGDSGDY